jgi:gluconolactonase
MKIRELATGLQFPEGPIAMDDGSVLLVEIARGTLTRVTADGKVSVVCETGGGPNGAAMGPDGAVYICNNGGFNWNRTAQGWILPVSQADDYSGGRIERVNLSSGRCEPVYDKVQTPRHGERALRGPNDLVFDAHGGFWFTDLGKARPRDMDRGGLYYAKADGSKLTEVAQPMITPNGCGLSPDGKVVYTAETEGARLWGFDITAPGEVSKQGFPSPHGGRYIGHSNTGALTRFDSMAVDAAGNVLVATLLNGGITTFSPDGKNIEFMPLDDPMVTNLCFGGKDMRTLYVTLSAKGRLIAIDDWPVAGLRLQYQ